MALMKFITENAVNSPYDQKYKDDNAIVDVIGYVCNPEKTNGILNFISAVSSHRMAGSSMIQEARRMQTPPIPGNCRTRFRISPTAPYYGSPNA